MSKSYICENCKMDFKQKNYYDKHMGKKSKCNIIVENSTDVISDIVTGNEEIKNRKKYNKYFDNDKYNLEDFNLNEEYKSSYWCFIIYPNDNTPEYDKINFNIYENKIKYMIIGCEFCPSTNKLYYQCYLQIKILRTFEFIKKILHDIFKIYGYIIPFNGTITQNIEYCKKNKKYKEYGIVENKYKKEELELIKLKDKILSGEMTSKQISIENPNAYHRYSKTLNFIQDCRDEKLEKQRPTTSEWIWGAPCNDKTKYIEQQAEKYDSVYYHNCDDGGWWDRYCGQELVIINDFRGSKFEYTKLLELLLWCRGQIQRRYKSPLFFTSKHIIINAINPPEIEYSDIIKKGHGISQLLKSLTNIKELQNTIYQDIYNNRKITKYTNNKDMQDIIQRYNDKKIKKIANIQDIC